MSGDQNISTYLPGLADSASPLNPRALKRLRSSKMTRGNAACCGTSGPVSESSATQKTSNPSADFARRLEALTCLRRASLASLQALSDKCAEPVTSVGSGLSALNWFASFDPVTQSLRTRQASLFSTTDVPGTELCQDWRHSGLICGGMYFPLPRLVPGISVSASFLLLPTPCARDWKDTPGMALEKDLGGGRTRNRDDQLPRRIYADGFSRGKRAKRGGMKLTPEFLCWLMGFPPNWLAPLVSAPGMQLRRKSSSRLRGRSGK